MNQGAPPSTSGSGPTMRSNLLLPTARLRLSSQRRSRRHSRHRIGRLCSRRSRDSRRIRGSRRIPGQRIRHRIHDNHRIHGLAARR